MLGEKMLLWQSCPSPRATPNNGTLPSGCPGAANSSALPGSNLQSLSFNPHPHLWTNVSGWGAQGGGTNHPCKSLSILPSANWLLRSPPRPGSSPSVLADLPASQGTSQVVGTFLLTQLPPRGTGPVPIPFSLSLFFCFFFCPTQVRGDFLALSEV